ncbi:MULTISPECIES: PAS domain-containing sensor histidine kinase [unclassified Novosphingobium]|uniref:sensor histidine kinase n=1 Tax=unclassified Novosphingobium TaxID=2644732 RepID=UPI001494DA28|nr:MULTISPECIES: HAMP domain-containing sensor histidine kinase [unclassified Novosphingobium]MBB3357376.1 signal transduction histidine kinase [Novosphingobium sp. BK256]MBB3373962.1 signal transduction histidine kinase [Novosphingobium sp. BK280]MBB3378374.1 signal transduction histidine kinase [Novosphingobium sp. BK258]MBB3419842.1 signal transduction histidine kinase [Novosphingobium sp. BK267]MBB3447837.1 signal transduction histidine kinase [Novosphingobium sp. BK352]
MASSSVRTALPGQLLLFGCGAATVAAWTGGFYACFVLVLLLGFWLASLALARAMPLHLPAERQVAAPDSETDRAVLRAVLDQAPTPLLSVERSGRVRALNRAARMLFDIEDVLIDVPEALRESAPRLRYAGRAYRIDRIEAHGAGAARTILALIDIESEERLAEARTTRELLDVLSHEVMNALTPIASLADSALATLDDTPPPVAHLRDMLGTLSRRADGLLHFTQAYRQLARLPEPVLAPTTLAVLFDDLRRMFAARWGGRVTFVADGPPDGMVFIDRDQISQALWALLQNGAEAAVAATDAPQVRLSARLDDRLSIWVADNGPGVPDEGRARIFRPFYTTKKEGSGIGLSLARQIARAHGGDLSLLPGRDTVFELALPSHGRNADGMHTAKPAADPIPGK